MTAEEYERLKEAEKAHLRRLRELKRTARGLERRRSISSALADLADRAATALRRQDDAADGLLRETARLEARLDLALDETPLSDDADQPPSTEALDAELARARAQTHVQRLRDSLGQDDEDDEVPPASASDRADASDPRPPKTIGRFPKP